MIENLQESINNQKVQKFVPVLDGNSSMKNAPKLSAKIRKTNMQNQTNTKHFSNPEDIFKSAKNFLEKRYPKEDSSKTTIS